MTLAAAYTYAVIRYVPRVDRDEAHNLGVVLYSQGHDFLDLGCAPPWRRLLACHDDVDRDRIEAAMTAMLWVCRGDGRAGDAGRVPLGIRFGFLTAPRSTVIQPGPVHSGRTADPERELARLTATVVG